jgi:hypothetical protein
LGILFAEEVTFYNSGFEGWTYATDSGGNSASPSSPTISMGSPGEHHITIYGVKKILDSALY